MAKENVMTYVKERPAAPETKVDTAVSDSHAPATSAPSDSSPTPEINLDELTVRHPINQTLRFYPSGLDTSPDSSPDAHPESPSSLSLMVLEALFIPDGPALLDCRLTLQIPFSIYQDILKNQWFNLIPSILKPDHDKDFDADQPIHLEIGLKPDQLEPLEELWASDTEESSDMSSVDEGTDPSSTEDPRSRNVDALVQHLITLNAAEIDDPALSLFHTDQWLCCSVQQHLDNGDVGYQTLWSYLLIHPLADTESDATDDVVEAFSTLFKEAAVTFQAEFEKQLPQLQSNWGDFLDGLKDFVDEVVEDLNEDQPSDANASVMPDRETTGSSEDESNSISLMEQVVKPFFDSEDWSFVQLDETTLQLAFQGNNGRWSCLAESSNEAQQFIFYSLYPFQVEANDQAAMLEFLMRANSGMIIGNFELDFAAGEVRFKTSVDVEGIHATLPSCSTVYQHLWQQLAYVNVITMDRYFPGITAIVNHTMTPEGAIAHVEQ